MAQWALSFDGTNDYVDCGAVATSNLAALAVLCWRMGDVTMERLR